MFTVSRVGPFSEALHALCPGDSVWVRGPFGTGFSLGSGRALLVGGGYGAAPLAFLARCLLTTAPAGSVEVALGARTSKDLLFVERFREMGVPVHEATEDGSRGATGRVTEVVKPLLAEDRFSRLQACGPESMLETLAEACRGAGGSGGAFLRGIHALRHRPVRRMRARGEARVPGRSRVYDFLGSAAFPAFRSNSESFCRAISSLLSTPIGAEILPQELLRGGLQNHLQANYEKGGEFQQPLVQRQSLSISSKYPYERNDDHAAWLLQQQCLFRQMGRSLRSRGSCRI